MEFDELAQTRRSVRHYKESGISQAEAKDTITEILDFVRVNAPSWKNSQTHRYYVALSAEKKQAVQEALHERNRAKCEHAIALVVSAFEKNTSGFTEGKSDNELGNEWGAYDLGLSDSLLLLKARAKGLDTLIMGLRDSVALRAALDIPESQEVAAVISVGIRDGEVARPGHKALEEITRFV
ncbi:MAG: nitroreductase family protein [Treponema sp.]|nr:nitroreductase family protein [Treponema sp.]